MIHQNTIAIIRKIKGNALIALVAIGSAVPVLRIQALPIPDKSREMFSQTIETFPDPGG